MARGFSPVALAVRYGQRHERELRAARQVAKRAGVALHEISLRLPWLKSSSLVDRGQRLPDTPLSRIGRDGIPSTYVPARNSILLSIGISLADALGAEAVIYGANALDYSGYPDCRPEFIAAFSRAARLGTRRGKMRILAPLSRLDKRRIALLAARLRAPMELTWSCYQGGAHPCRSCDSCKLRAKGFEEAGLADPALS